jgi:Tfp pilus assembly protein PilX
MSVLQRSTAALRPVLRPAPARLRQRLADERGIALIMALAVMLTLTVLVASTLAFTSSDSRDASRSVGTQKAYAAAEAGLNDALAAVQVAGSDTTKMSPSPAFAGDTSATVTSLTAGATATWGGSFNSTTKVWTLKSIGAVPNPTGASAITRTLTQTATLTPPPFNFVALDTGCDVHTLIVDSSGQLNVTNKMYINSCNGVQTGVKPDAFDIFGTVGSGNISAPSIQVVGGWETDGGVTPNSHTVTVNGIRCARAKGNNPVSSSQPTGCPLTGQPSIGDPLAGKVSPPALGSAACTSTGYGTPANYSPSQTVSTSMTVSTTTLKSSGTAIQNGDVVQIGTEEMLVTAGGGTKTLTVQRAYLGTTAATHNSGTTIQKVPAVTYGTAANPAPCTIASGTVTLQPGTYYGGICIGAWSGSSCGSNIGGSCQDGNAPVAYSPAVLLNASSGISSTTTSIPVDWSGSSTADPVSTGDVILIGSEQMLVTNAPATNGSATLTVTRHYNGTTAATHSNNSAVTQEPPVGTANVTFAPGTYIMAGGGLFLCGVSALSAPDVLIYNTQDPSKTSGSGAIDQVEINTTGSVSLGPQNSGAYEGLTYYQDPNLAVAPSDTCENRTYFANNPDPNAPTQSQVDEYDLALMSMASSGSNGALGSVSGSFYAPANTAEFADAVSGTANLAVLTSCILIDGGNSTFAFQPSGLFGSTWVLGPQAG